MSRYLSSGEFPAILWLEFVILEFPDLTSLSHLGGSRISVFSCPLGSSGFSTSFLSSRRLMAFHSLLSSWRLLAFSLLYVIFAAADFPPGSCHLSG
ncbi:hypothetical protein AVEN_141264-1 [Araneus ventricosus]|uniref:Uncharacterized protein n=1 Tax=Araneus ventricosus TaxID=182803 RepID=A0A4Y2RZZ4_ARAVE|nr:hypothetical protein AVEN_141264-1 [Araneus ventricosus]